MTEEIIAKLFRQKGLGCPSRTAEEPNNSKYVEAAK